MRPEPLGTRQMKWLDFFMWNYHMYSCRLKKIWWDGNGERFDNPIEDSTSIVYPMDHRFTFPGEAIFDLDLKPPFDAVKLAELADDIVWHLRDENEVPVLCHSGGSGYHIHVFKSEPKVAEELCKDMINRFHLDKLVGHSKVVDMNLLHNNHMIRIIGGRKYLGRQRYMFKSVISRASEFVPVDEKDDVIFPSRAVKDAIKANMNSIYIRESLNKIGNSCRNIKHIDRSVLDTVIDI